MSYYRLVMSLEDKLNSSFLEKLRNSITRPFIPLITATTIALTGCNSVNGSNQDQISCLSDYDCYGEKVCIEKKCIELSNNSEYIGDIEVTFSKSNQEGLALFVDNQTGEEVKIYVKDELNVPIENANVAFWDGDGFETFQVDHPDYTPLIEIFSHNSSHHFLLFLLICPNTFIFG